MDPEKSHRVALRALRVAHSFGVTKAYKKMLFPHHLMGLHFDNPIGLAAGLDKNGDYIDALGALGFGFIEIGTVTPKPQTGNPSPRLFRLPAYQAIVNRMGFNNKGLEYVVERLKHSTYSGVLGVNIGKNRDTPLARADEDYVAGFRGVAPFASYVTINISSPNTEGLRSLQEDYFLRNLLAKLKREQQLFFAAEKKYVPLAVKIAPDLTDEEIKKIAEIVLEEKMNGVIATNTTIRHDSIGSFHEKGGLSGKPLATQSTHVIKKLHDVLQNQIPIIGCGGVFTSEDAKEKLQAGAKLLQIYTGLIYEGPGIISQLVRQLANYSTVTDLAKLRG